MLILLYFIYFSTLGILQKYFKTLTSNILREGGFSNPPCLCVYKKTRIFQFSLFVSIKMKIENYICTQVFLELR